MKSSSILIFIKHFIDEEIRAIKKLFSISAKSFDFLSYLITQYIDINQINEERIAEIMHEDLNLKINFLFQII